MSRARAELRKRGNIEERGGALRVRLYAGVDPVTGKQVYHRTTVQGTDDAAWKRAEDKLTEFRAQVLKQRNAPSAVKLGYALDEWMRTSELEESTRHTYEGYIERLIRPALGNTSVSKVDARALESLYTELRLCRSRCNGQPFIAKHTVDGDHDCTKSECRVHECKPFAASTIRQMHAIISGALAAAER